jgi:hypothetical protein
MTMSGEPYGPGVRKRVSITQYGTVGLLVTVGAALVLFGTATLRVVRRATAGGGPGRGARIGRAPVPPARPAQEAAAPGMSDPADRTDGDVPVEQR